MQKLRKLSGLNIEDDIVVYYETTSQFFKDLVASKMESMVGVLRVPLAEKGEVSTTHIAGEDFEYKEEKLRFDVYWKNK
jgi:hypothetical protein